MNTPVRNLPTGVTAWEFPATLDGALVEIGANTGAFTHDSIARVEADSQGCLVPDVKAGISRVLRPSLDVEFTSAGNRGPTARVKRRPNGSA